MALVVALVILIVITLLGIMGIRRAQLQSRLSANAESTVMARTTAGVNALAIANASPPLASVVVGDSFNTCWLPSGTVGPGSSNFTCSSANAANSAALAAFAATLPTTEQAYSYFMVKRETPSTLPTNSLRNANLSGVAYQFASFSLLAGFDGSNNDSGIAEVDQTMLVPTARIAGLTEQ